jgi:thioredoxin reductase (NADPH)
VDELNDIVIVGAGPAGLTAGLFTGRAMLRTVIIEKQNFGGELMNREMIGNYPSYPNGVLGPELGSRMMEQATKYGVEFAFGDVRGIRIEKDRKIVITGDGEYAGKAVILAGGSRPKKLGVPGEEQFQNKGVFYCATCDGPRFANKVMAVAGGGDSGLTEALQLERYVTKAIILECQPRLTATKIVQQKVSSDPKIEIKCGFRIDAICGRSGVESLNVTDMNSGKKSLLEAGGVLVHVGIEPNTDYLKGMVPLNERGQVIVNDKMESESEGFFAAGDIRQNSA